jgi:predicted DNA-binding transcriptional regulator YafY
MSIERDTDGRKGTEPESPPFGKEGIRLPKDFTSIRIERLNRIMTLLCERRPVSKERLMEEGEYACPRTLERDLKFLEDGYGVSLEYLRSKGGYLLRGQGRFLLQMGLSEGETEALASGLAAGCRFLPHLSGDCDRLSRLFRAYLPPERARQVEELSQLLAIAHPVGRMDPAIFETLLTAIRERRVVDARYRSPWSGESRDHRLHPWGLFFRAHAWYLWAGKEGKDSPGTYRISRFERVVSLSAPPRRDPPEGCDLEGFAGSAWYGCPGEIRHRVRVRFRGALGEVVAETEWHPTQRIDREPDGATVLTVEVPDLDEIARWVLTNGVSAEVLEPEELRTKVRTMAEGIAAVYRGAPPGRRSVSAGAAPRAGKEEERS